MEITVKRVDDAFHMEGKGSGPLTVSIDAGEPVGGKNKGARPMELVLMGMASCSAIDVISILKKQRQKIDDLNIVANADRADATPAVFSKIHLEFQFKGDLDENKIQRAMDLSIEKYCSVSKMLEKTAEISYSFTLNQ